METISSRLQAGLQFIVHTNQWGVHAIRIAIFIIFIWIGGLKFWNYEAEGIVPFVANSPFMNFFYEKKAPEYKDYKIYEGKFSITVPLGLVLANTADSDDFVLNGDFLGCTKSGFCYQPQQFGFSFKRVVEGYQISKISNSELKKYRSGGNSAQISAADGAQSGTSNFESNTAVAGAETDSVADSHAAGNSATSLTENAAVNSDESSAHKNPRDANSISEQDKILNVLGGKSFIAAIALFFGYGVLLSLSPCVYPLIPILSSIIVAKTSSTPRTASRRTRAWQWTWSWPAPSTTSRSSRSSASAT